MDTREQGFFYIIPAKLAEEGKPTKALLYGLITSLINKEGFCWATNVYLAQKMGMRSKTQVSIYLNELVKEGWVVAEVDVKAKHPRKISLASPVLDKHKQLPHSEFRMTRSEKRKAPFGNPSAPLSENRKKVVSNRVVSKEYTYSSKVQKSLFEELWKRYPLKTGKSKAFKKFAATVTSEMDIKNIRIALSNYKIHLSSNAWKHPQDGKTWFANWQDWVEPVNQSVKRDDSCAIDDLIKKTELLCREKLNGQVGEVELKAVMENTPAKLWPQVKRHLDARCKYNEEVYRQIEEAVNAKMSECRDKFQRLMGGESAKR